MRRVVLLRAVRIYVLWHLIQLVRFSLMQLHNITGPRHGTMYYQRICGYRRQRIDCAYRSWPLLPTYGINGCCSRINRYMVNTRTYWLILIISGGKFPENPFSHDVIKGFAPHGLKFIFVQLCVRLTLNTVGKVFSRRHFQIFFLVFPENRI